MWLLIGSHSAISRQAWYYLSELILAGIKRSKAENKPTYCIPSCFLSPFKVLKLAPQTHSRHRAQRNSALKGNSACEEVSPQWPLQYCRCNHLLTVPKACVLRKVFKLKELLSSKKKRKKKRIDVS
jgi:hypothetical protein